MQKLSSRQITEWMAYFKFIEVMKKEAEENKKGEKLAQDFRKTAFSMGAVTKAEKRKIQAEKVRIEKAATNKG